MSAEQPRVNKSYYLMFRKPWSDIFKLLLSELFEFDDNREEKVRCPTQHIIYPKNIPRPFHTTQNLQQHYCYNVAAMLQIF